MKLIELCCKNCGASLQPENLSMQLLIARCPHCDAVFAITDASRTPSATSELPRQPVAMPRQIQVLDQGYGLEIRRSWFTPMLFFLVFFCIIWNGFMVVWHVISLSTGMWLMSCFGLVHTAVGIGLAYVTIAGFVNQTVIRVGQGMLTVQHGPLPWGGNKTVPSHEIKQLYCKEHVQRSQNSNSLTYSVEMILDNGRETLVKGLHECDQAIYIEQELERFLKIEDKPVSGELPR
ncbi:MAG: hypothetical protein EA424_24990 [Planctomycetaceae bacterium]|nr:MAG: hypothetical protein EA424_24990 [Planctomycetaceae bacterium]